MVDVYDMTDLVAAVRATDFTDDYGWNEPAPESELCFE